METKYQSIIVLNKLQKHQRGLSILALIISSFLILTSIFVKINLEKWWILAAAILLLFSTIIFLIWIFHLQIVQFVQFEQFKYESDIKHQQAENTSKFNSQFRIESVKWEKTYQIISLLTKNIDDNKEIKNFSSELVAAIKSIKDELDKTE